MSIRAYKIKKIEVSKKPCFNVSYEYDWLENLASWKAFNDDSEVVFMEFEKESLKESISETKDKEKRIILKGILKDIPKDDYYVMYECY